MGRGLWIGLLATLLLVVPGSAAGSLRLVDRAIVAFIASETGGARSPRFIFERVLAFEARLEALSEPRRSLTDRRRPYLEHHVRAAMERHIAETLLASLNMDPEPSPEDLARQTQTAERILLARIGGAAGLERAASAEGIDRREIFDMLRRRARASLYLHRHVAPMLAPSEAELKRVHAQAPGALGRQPYERVREALRRWYIGRRLASAVAAYYQSARSRITVTLLDRR